MHAPARAATTCIVPPGAVPFLLSHYGNVPLIKMVDGGGHVKGSCSFWVAGWGFWELEEQKEEIQVNEKGK